MKNILFIALIIFFFLNAQGQKLTENKVDEFTHLTLKRTSWEVLWRGTFSAPGMGYFRISTISGTTYFDLKFNTGSTFFIDKGQMLMFKLKNDSIVTLYNLQYTTPCKGCGSKGLVGSGIEGVETSYELNDVTRTLLTKNPIIKIRVYTNDGYVEYPIKENMDNEIKEAINLTK